LPSEGHGCLKIWRAVRDLVDHQPATVRGVHERNRRTTGNAQPAQAGSLGSGGPR